MVDGWCYTYFSSWRHSHPRGRHGGLRSMDSLYCEAVFNLSEEDAVDGPLAVKLFQAHFWKSIGHDEPWFKYG